MGVFQILVITIVVKSSAGFLMTPNAMVNGNYQKEVAKKELLRLIKVRQLVVDIYNALTLGVSVREKELESMINRDIEDLKSALNSYLRRDNKYVPNIRLLENMHNYLLSNLSYDMYKELLDNWARAIESETFIDLNSPFLKIIDTLVTSPLNFLGIESSYNLAVTPREPDTCVKSFVVDLIENNKRVFMDFYNSTLNLTEKSQEALAIKMMNHLKKLGQDLEQMRDENSRRHAENVATYIEGLKSVENFSPIGSHEFLNIVFRDNINYDVKNDSHVDTPYWRRVMKFLNQPLAFLGHHFELYNIDQEISTCLKFNMISLIQKRKRTALQYKICAVKFGRNRRYRLKHQIETFRDQPWMNIVNTFVDNHVPSILTNESVRIDKYLYTLNQFTKLMTDEPLEELDPNFWMEVKTFLTVPLDITEKSSKAQRSVDGNKKKSNLKRLNVEDKVKNNSVYRIAYRIGEVGKMVHANPKSDYFELMLDSLKTDMDKMNLEECKSPVEYLNKNIWPRWTRSKNVPLVAAQLSNWFLTYLRGTMKITSFEQSYYETKCWKRIMAFVSP